MSSADAWREMRCPLCGTTGPTVFHHGARGVFLRCSTCALVFLDPAQWPSLDAEIARYELHENDDDDPRYQEFLSRLADPLIACTLPGHRGLDFGSGESDALAQLLTRAGRPTSAYDAAFRPDDALLRQRYEFVVCSEVLEHAHDPRSVLDQLGALVGPNGIIGVMTGMYDVVPSFADWWYIRDITHVCFYSKPTMEWIARAYAWSVEFPAPNVALFFVESARRTSA